MLAAGPYIAMALVGMLGVDLSGEPHPHPSVHGQWLGNPPRYCYVVSAAASALSLGGVRVTLHIP